MAIPEKSKEYSANPSLNEVLERSSRAAYAQHHRTPSQTNMQGGISQVRELIMRAA